MNIHLWTFVSGNALSRTGCRPIDIMRRTDTIDHQVAGSAWRAAMVKCYDAFDAMLRRERASLAVTWLRH